MSLCFVRPIFQSVIFALCVSFVSISAPVHAEDARTSELTLPFPKGLEAEVAFWQQVFAQLNSDQGLIYDDEHLARVYAQVDIPAGLDGDGRRQYVKDQLNLVKNNLSLLAQGRKDGELAQIAQHFPKDADAADYQQARERVRFQLGKRNQLRDSLQRSGRWRATIREALTHLSVPEDLVALPHVETLYRNEQRSSHDAVGVWQFTPATGRLFLQVEDGFDERLDPRLAARGAAALLRHNLEITGNWPLAITAYNHGTPGIVKATEAVGSDNLADIIHTDNGPLLGFASRNFYVQLYAAAEIDRHWKLYFPKLTFDEAPNIQLLRLEQPLAPIQVIAALNIDKDAFIPINPAIESHSLTHPLPEHTPIWLPCDEIDCSKSTENLSSALINPTMYAVLSGDTLSAIAAQFNTSITALRTLNNLDEHDIIRIGDRLQLPTGSDTLLADAGQTPPSQAPTVQVLSADLSAAKTPEPETPPVQAPEPVLAQAQIIDIPTYQEDSKYYQVKDGAIIVQAEETLALIASWSADAAEHWQQVNQLPEQSIMIIGQSLKIPETTDPDDFFQKRIAWHKKLQEDFFSAFKITGIERYQARAGAGVIRLSQETFGMPVWLLRGYNPDIGQAPRLTKDTELVIPTLEAQNT